MGVAFVKPVKYLISIINFGYIKRVLGAKIRERRI
jgi:hypothetical protein